MKEYYDVSPVVTVEMYFKKRHDVTFGRSKMIYKPKSHFSEMTWVHRSPHLTENWSVLLSSIQQLDFPNHAGT